MIEEVLAWALIVLIGMIGLAVIGRLLAFLSPSNRFARFGVAGVRAGVFTIAVALFLSGCVVVAFLMIEILRWPAWSPFSFFFGAIFVVSWRIYFRG